MPPDDRILAAIDDLRRELQSVLIEVGTIKGSHEDLKHYTNGRGELRLSSVEERLRLSELTTAGQKVMLAAICSVAGVVTAFLVQFLMKMAGAR